MRAAQSPAGRSGFRADGSPNARVAHGSTTESPLRRPMTPKPNHPPSAARRRLVVTHTRSLTFDQAEVDAVWNSGVLPIPDYILAGDEATDPDERAIAVYTA